jgi:hypothetical protein
MRLTDTLQRAVDERLEEGLRVIEEQAADLMRGIASEMWRDSGADVRSEQDRLITLLSRDQSVRSLLQSGDERYQALAMRAQRLEDTMMELAESSRATRMAMEASANSIKEIARSPTLRGVEEVRSQLEQVEHHIAAAFASLQERDQAIAETVREQVREHSELITQETSRIVEAMEGYVQGGAEAVGKVAERMEKHAETFATFEGPQEWKREIEQLVEARAMSLAQLIRSDSEALRRLIEEQTAAREQAVEAEIEEHMSTLHLQVRTLAEEARTHAVELAEGTEARLAEVIRDADETRSERERIAEDARIQRETGVFERLEDFGASIERKLEDLRASSEEGLESLRAATEEKLSNVARTAEEQISALTLGMSARIEQTTAELGARLDSKLDESRDAIFSIGTLEGVENKLDELRANWDALEAIDAKLDDVMATQAAARSDARVLRLVDERFTAMAQLIRADNQVLASRLAELAEAASTETINAENVKDLVRSVKEMQAGLASDVIGTMDRRIQSVSDQLHNETQSTAEALAKVTEVLGDKIDSMSGRVEDDYANDLQVVIDRMGDAIQAMSVVGHGR